MNVAAAEPGPAPVCGDQCDWVDPEGDDWLASIYRFLTEDGKPVGGEVVPSLPPPDLEHWFG
jgi:hypothetical protein